MPQDNPQNQFTNGLRALADLLDESDVVQPHDDYWHLICVWTAEELVDTCRRLGGRWEKDQRAATISA